MNIWVRDIRMAVLASLVLLLIGVCAASAQPPRFEIFGDDAGRHPPGFAGIGAVLSVEVDGETNEEQIIISAVIPGTPAEKAGIRPGDRILEIDGEPVEDLTLKEVVERIRGEEGTEVKFTLVREGEDDLLEVGIVRDNIRVGVPPDFMGQRPGRRGGMMGQMPGGPGGMMGPMMGMMPQPQPVMLIDQGYLYILTGNVLFKLDAETLEQINAVHLIPPPPPPGMMGPPPPRPPPEGMLIPAPPRAP